MSGNCIDVLVVSRDESFLDAAGEVLRSAGCNVTCQKDVSQVATDCGANKAVMVAYCPIEEIRYMLGAGSGRTHKVILVSDDSSCMMIAEALRLGAYDYFQTPIDFHDLAEAVVRACQDDCLPPELPKKAAQAMQQNGSFRNASLETVRALVRAVEAKDPFTRRHSDNVASYAAQIARLMGMSEADVETVRVAALLHDVGMIGVPDEILTKAGPLTETEFEHIRRHPALGAHILEQIGVFATEAHIVRHHHERWDGRGYPDCLAREESPLGARVLFIADSIDAMLMPRSYRNAYPIEKMMDELARCAGRQFDPAIAAKVLQWCDNHREDFVLPQPPAESCIQ